MENNTQNSFPMNLIKGEITLWKTYWLFGVLGNIIGSFLIVVFTAMGNTLMFIMVAIVIVYSIITLIGIWNSASNYTGSKIWAILAQVMVVFGFLSTLAQFNE